MARKCDKQLEWWLNLVNQFPPLAPAEMASMPKDWYRPALTKRGFAERLLRLEPVEHRPAGLNRLFRSLSLEEHRAFARQIGFSPLRTREDGVSPHEDDEAAHRLAAAACSILQGLALQTNGRTEWYDSILLREYAHMRANPLLWSPLPDPGGVVMTIQDGQVSLTRVDPLSSLCALLDGRPANIVGLCPVCGRLFERLRIDQECDTPRCRDADRKRAERKPEYEENRRINRLVRAGMPLNEAKAEVRRTRRKRRGVR